MNKGQALGIFLILFSAMLYAIFDSIILIAPFWIFGVYNIVYFTMCRFSRSKTDDS